MRVYSYSLTGWDICVGTSDAESSDALTARFMTGPSLVRSKQYKYPIAVFIRSA